MPNDPLRFGNCNFAISNHNHAPLEAFRWLCQAKNPEIRMQLKNRKTNAEPIWWTARTLPVGKTLL